MVLGNRNLDLYQKRHEQLFLLLERLGLDQLNRSGI